MRLRKLLLTLLVAGVAYAAVWALLTGYNEQLLSRIIRAESVSTTGFPGNTQILFHKPEVTIGNAVLSSEEPLMVSYNVGVTGIAYHLTLPLNITFRAYGNVLHCRFAQPPLAQIALKPFMGGIRGMPAFHALLRQMEYQDAGGRCEDVTQGSRFHYEAGHFTLQNERREGRGVAHFNGEITGDVQMMVDMEMDGYEPFLANEFPENSELRINAFNIENPSYSAKLKGYIKLNKTDIFPYGLLQLQLVQITPMLDALYADSASRMPERKQFQTLLYELAGVDAKEAEGMENISISMRRRSGEDLQVGALRLSEFLQRWRALFTDDDNRRAQ